MYFESLLNDIMSWLGKNWPSFLLLLAGLVACIASFFSNKQDQEQKDSIENFTKQNIKLSEEIKNLSIISNEISERIEKMTEANNILSVENFELAKQNKDLISDVRGLTDQSKELIKKINKQVEYQAAANIITEELEMDFETKSTLSDKDLFKIKIGGISHTNPILYLKKGLNLKLSVEGKEHIFVKLGEKNNLLFSFKILDVDGNILVELEENRWRPNKNLISKYNYDKTGFEVFNNKGQIIISLDIISNDLVVIQGIFASKESDVVLFYGNGRTTTIPMKNSERAKKLSAKQGKSYEEIFNDAIKMVEVKQLFEYTGKDWLHKRKIY